MAPLKFLRSGSPYLGDDEEVRPAELATVDPLLEHAPHHVLVLVHVRRVDVAVAHLERCVQRRVQLGLHRLHTRTSRQLYIGNVSFIMQIIPL